MLLTLLLCINGLGAQIMTEKIPLGKLQSTVQLNNLSNISGQCGIYIEKKPIISNDLVKV